MKIGVVERNGKFKRGKKKDCKQQRQIRQGNKDKKLKDALSNFHC